jgi:hypothetical protein
MEKIITLKNNRELEITQDTDIESPNDWGNTDIFLVYDHRQLNIKRKGFEPEDIYNWLELIKGVRINNKPLQHPIPKGNYKVNGHDYSDYYIFPVEAYIHSGISLSLFTGTKQCRWDSSVTGFILVHREELDYPLQRTQPELENKSDLEIAKHYAKGLIDTWNTYLAGNVYIITLYNLEECPHCGHEEKEEIDSIGNIYANGEQYIKEAAMEYFDLKEEDFNE